MKNSFTLAFALTLVLSAGLTRAQTGYENTTTTVETRVGTFEPAFPV
jgi:hypothetical protein